MSCSGALLLHSSTQSVRSCPPCMQQGQLLDELDTEIEGTSTRIAAAQKKVGGVP